MNELPPLSPLSQLIYDIMDIVETGVQSAGDLRRASLESLAQSVEALAEDDDAVECSLDKITLTLRVSPHARVS